jgi:hypothetical protein
MSLLDSIYWRLTRVCSVILFSAISLASTAAEVAPFRLTDVEGFVGLEFREDEQSRGATGSGTASFENRRAFREELFVLTHSYVYHPNFLTMELGGGPLFVQDMLKTNTGSNEDDNLLWNLIAQLHFLEEKPTPLTLYYNRDHPTVSLSLLDTFENQHTRYGFNFQVRQPLSPINFSLEASRNESLGNGFNLIVNDVVDQAIFRANLPIGRAGFVTLAHNATQSESKTHYSNTSPPEEASKVRVGNTTLDSRVFLGAKREFQLTNFLSYTERTETFELQELRYTPNLRWQHSADLRSFYTLNYLNSKQQDVKTDNLGMTAGFSRNLGERFSLNGDVRGSNNKTTGLELRTYGGRALLDYRQPLSFGQLALAAGLNYDNIDRVAAAFVPVRDLRYTLTGTIPQMLPHDNISIPTITIYEVSPSGTIIGDPLDKIEDTTCPLIGDVILITPIDVRTQITHCNATAGQILRISVDYEFDPGGSVGFTNLQQNYQASLDMFRYYNVYVRYRNNDVDIYSGAPTLPLEENQVISTGAKVDYPWSDMLSMGLDVKYRQQDGTVTSYLHDSYDAYLQFDFFTSGIRLAEKRSRTDYANTTEDVDLTRHSLQFRYRPFYRFNFVAEVSDEKDVGSSNPRRSRRYSFNAEWRIRRLILSGEGRLVEETQTSTDRDRYMIRFGLRRDF